MAEDIPTNLRPLPEIGKKILEILLSDPVMENVKLSISVDRWLNKSHTAYDIVNHSILVWWGGAEHYTISRSNCVGVPKHKDERKEIYREIHKMLTHNNFKIVEKLPGYVKYEPKP